MPLSSRELCKHRGLSEEPGQIVYSPSSRHNFLRSFYLFPTTCSQNAQQWQSCLLRCYCARALLNPSRCMTVPHNHPEVHNRVKESGKWIMSAHSKPSSSIESNAEAKAGCRQVWNLADKTGCLRGSKAEGCFSRRKQSISPWTAPVSPNPNICSHPIESVATGVVGRHR